MNWLRMFAVAGLISFGIYIVSSHPDFKAYFHSEPVVETIRVASSTIPMSAPLIIAKRLGYFEKEGVNVSMLGSAYGRLSMDKMFIGEADLALVGETPLILNALENQEFQILASIFISDQGMGMLVNDKSSIEKPTDLVNKRIGIVSRTSSEYFTHLFFLFYNIQPAEVELVPMQPEEMSEALSKNKVDAVVIWEPYLTRLANEAIGPEKRKIFYGEGIHVWRWNIVGNTDFVVLKHEVIKKFLIAIRKAIIFIQQNQNEAITIMSKEMNMAPSDIEKFWNAMQFRLALDQSLLTALETQSRWYLTVISPDPKQDVPNFLQYINSTPLKSVSPDTVTIIE